MNKNKLRLVSSLAILMTTSGAHGYTTHTHTAMTWYAVRASKLGADPSMSPIVDQLGLTGMVMTKPGAPFRSSLNDNYVAVGAPSLLRSAGAAFDQKIMKEVRDPTGTPDDFSLAAWLMRGAIREDDNSYENPTSDEPGGVFQRVFAHFYDPQFDRALTVPALGTIGARAPDWALVNGTTSRAGLDDSAGRTNLYNLGAAKEAMWRALTGKTTAGADATPETSGITIDPEGVRKAYWATTFRVLGDMVHLLQDMAQPQHTRNDSHSGLGCVKLIGCAGGHDSYYEHYVDALTLGTGSFTLSEGFLNQSSGKPISITPYPLPYGAYPALPMAKFKNYSDFFSTGTGDGGNQAGVGLANYSNRGFYTVGTNADSSTYPLPARSAQFDDTRILPSGAKMTFLSGTVPDTVTGTSDNARLSTMGAWDRFLPRPLRSYSLNDYNYDDQVGLLVPRAVSYSAGLIDFFFRGRIKVGLPDEGVYAVIDHAAAQIADPNTNFTGFNAIKANVSAPDTDNNGQPQSLANGVLTAVLKFRRNRCYVNDLSAPPSDEYECRSADEQIVVSDPVNGGAAIALSSTPQPFVFKFPQALPINATDVRLQVIYRGTLGPETDAVVVATQDISEPTFFSYLNGSDYNVIAGKVYDRATINSTPALLDQVYPQSCVDRSVEPAQLRADCLQPFSVATGLTTGTLDKKVSVDVAALPVRRFSRLAILGSPTVAAAFAQKDTNTCYPHTPYSVTPLEWEDVYSPGDNTITETTSQLSSERGVWMWAGTSCVGNGDGSQPGSADDRVSAWASLKDVDPAPYPVKINDGRGYPEQ
jgi:hypothetical protein